MFKKNEKGMGQNKNFQNEMNGSPTTGGTGGTGGLGGTPATGGTGGIGGPDDSRKTGDGFDYLRGYAQESVRAVFHGSTGGVGGVPENIEELNKLEHVETRMKDVLSEEIAKANVDDLLTDVLKGYQTIERKKHEHHIDVVPHAIHLGMILDVLKERRVEYKDWASWVDQNIVKPLGIGLRTCQKYMAIAATPGVENYTEYGIDLLAKVGSSYLAMTPDEKQEIEGDAVGYFLGKFKAEEHYEMRREHLKAVVLQKNLTSQNIDISIEVIKAYLEQGMTFSIELRKHLKTLTREGEAEQFIEMVMDTEGTWKSLLSEDEIPDAKNNAAVQDDNDSAAKAALAASGNVRIPRLKEQTVTFRDSIKAAMASKSYETEVTAEDIDALIADLFAYKQGLVAAKDTGEGAAA